MTDVIQVIVDEVTGNKKYFLDIGIISFEDAKNILKRLKTKFMK